MTAHRFVPTALVLPLLALFALSVGVASPARAALSVTYQEGQGVVIKDLSPGGEVAYLFAEQSPKGWSMVLSTGHGVAKDDDGDAVVVFEREAVPAHGIFVAVDRTTGETAWGAPEGYRFSVGSLGVERFTSSGSKGDGPSTLEWGWQEVTGLLVRPSASQTEPSAEVASGTWWIDAADGSDGDLTGPADNRLSFAFSSAEPADQAAAPESLRSDDRLAIIDLETMSLHLWPGTAIFGEPGTESSAGQGGVR